LQIGRCRDLYTHIQTHLLHSWFVCATRAQAGYLQPSWAKKIVSFNESRRNERRDLHRPRHARTGPSASTVLPPPLLRQWKRRRPCRRTCWNRWRTGRGVGPSLPVTMTWQARYWLRMGADELLRMTMWWVRQGFMPWESGLVSFLLDAPQDERPVVWLLPSKYLIGPS
jgi:hypothetical protein